MVEHSNFDTDHRKELSELLGEPSEPTQYVAREWKPEPWFRAHKQYVRRFLWSREIVFLLRDLSSEASNATTSLAKSEPLRYFTLPGEDLLDIRFIVKKICPQFSKRIYYYGFNLSQSDAVERQSAVFDLRRSEYVDPGSHIHGVDVRILGFGKPSKKPMHAIQENFFRESHFHVINLDLCESLATEKLYNDANYFSVLSALLDKQSSATHDSLLFITSRMDAQSTCQDDYNKLITTISDLLQSDKQYADSFISTWCSAAVDNKPEYLLQNMTFEMSFTWGLVHWIITESILRGLVPHIGKFFVYRTGRNEGAEDIVSFSIRLKPNHSIRGDTSLLVRSPNLTDENGLICEHSIHALKAIKNWIRVDRKLLDDETFRSCINDMEDLIRSAGYDCQDYRQWEQNGEMC